MVAFTLNHIKDFNWKIQINGEHQSALYFCLIKMVTGTYDPDKNIFFFNASNAINLKHFLELRSWRMSIEELILMIDSLSKQINLLSSKG